MSTIQQAVSEQLAKYALEPLPNGFRLSEEQGTTDITFRSVIASPEQASCTIATIETTFCGGWPPLTAVDIARMNGRAVFGHIFRDQDTLRAKLTLSLRDNDPAWFGLSLFLLQAFGAQLACTFGIIRSGISERFLQSARDALEYPQQWSTPPRPDQFSAAVAAFVQSGYPENAITAGPTHFSLEIPLSPTALPRNLDPASEVAMLLVASHILHPIAGAGYFCQIVLPAVMPVNEAALWCANLNAIEHVQENFVPRIGAWGLHEGGADIVYSMFLPQEFSAEPSGLMAWLAERTFWLQDWFWVAGEGLKQKPAAS
jgi:hypothetical protein